MEAMNPFNSKEFKEKILAKEGKQEASDDYELFDDIIEEKSDLKNIIVGAPSIPKKAAANMDFERAMELSDILFELKGK